MDAFAFTDAIVVTPRKIRAGASLLVEGGKVTGFGLGARREVRIGSGAYVYPALVNVHDHLRGNYLPRVGPAEGSFYPNWSRWDADLKASPVFAERSALSVAQMYLLGAYKNLFSGVGTVNDHFPHELNDDYLDTLPIRAIREYCLAHECSSFDLKWGDGIEVEHARAALRAWPFITHLEEGFDPESMDGIGILERAKALDDRDLLVHCIGFSEGDIKKVKRAGASVAWCPASNYFMFNLTCKVRKLLRAGVNVALGHRLDPHRLGQPARRDEIRPQGLPGHLRRGAPRQDPLRHGDDQRRSRPGTRRPSRASSSREPGLTRRCSGRRPTIHTRASPWRSAKTWSC